MLEWSARSFTMDHLQGFLVFLSTLSISTAQPRELRGSRSLEEVPYLPPDIANQNEPYIPPVALNLIPPDSKDYLPPLKVSSGNGLAHASAESIGDMAQVYASVADYGSSPAPVSAEIGVEPKGYFYPKPQITFKLPNEEGNRVATFQSSGINEEPTETSSDAPNFSDRNVRSPQNKLRINPEDGPVIISTQPFQLTREGEKKNLNVRKPDEKKTKPRPGKGQVTAQILPAVVGDNKSRREAEKQNISKETSDVKVRRQVDNRRQTRPAPYRPYRPGGPVFAQTLPARAPPKVFP